MWFQPPGRYESEDAKMACSWGALFNDVPTKNMLYFVGRIPVASLYRPRGLEPGNPCADLLPRGYIDQRSSTLERIP